MKVSGSNPSGFLCPEDEGGREGGGRKKSTVKVGLVPTGQQAAQVGEEGVEWTGVAQLPHPSQWFWTGTRSPVADRQVCEWRGGGGWGGGEGGRGRIDTLTGVLPSTHSL